MDWLPRKGISSNHDCTIIKTNKPILLLCNWHHLLSHFNWPAIGTTFYFTFYKNYNWPWQMHRTTIYLSLGLSYFSIIINHIWQICIKNKQYKFIYLFFSSPSFRMVKTAHPRSPLDQQLNRCSQPSAMSYLRICKQNLIQYRPIRMNILIPYFRTAPFWQSNILKINVEIYYN